MTIMACLAALLFWIPSAFARADINDIYVIHFVIDGTNLKTFNETLAEGRMPTIKKRFVEEGAAFEQGLSAFPSTSTSVYQAYSTGLWPGHAGIPHLERFDRQRKKVIGYLSPSGFGMINSDLINLRALTNPEVAKLDPPTTIFELLDEWPTAVVYSSFSQGSTKRHPKKAPIHALWSTYVSEAPENVDVLAMKHVMKMYRAKLGEIPRYTLVGLYSSDICGHKYGPKSDRVKDVLMQFDIFMQDFIALLDKRGIGDKTYIIITADHGMHETGKLFKLREAMIDRGWILKSSPPPNKNFEIYSANRGVVSSHAYVKHDGGFEPLRDPDVLKSVPLRTGEKTDLIEFIRSLDATDLILVRAGERRTRIIGHDGKWADVECYTVGLIDHCAYLMTKGDPLGYSKNPKIKPLLDGRPHDTQAWKEATADERYPDAVIGLSQIFHDGRAGDMFVTTRERYGFRKVKEGNHGGPQASDMRVPMLIRGPTVPKGTQGAARPMDMYALLLDWFGIEVPDGNHDGSNPLIPYKGEDRDLSTLALLDQTFDDSSAARTKKGSIGSVVGSRKKRVRDLARKESAMRLKLAEKLTTLLADMEASKTTGRYDKKYTDDHIAIIKRTLDWTAAGHERMVAIKEALGEKSK